MSTNIEWTDKTWNPVTGCTRISAGCDNCYAERMAHRLEKIHAAGYPIGFGITFHWDKLERPLRWRKPCRVFVNSMGDLFHYDVPFDFIDKVMAIIARCPQHTFQVLTKRQFRMREYFIAHTPPSNLWLGVTVENQQAADERIPVLLDTPAARRFISVEPMLGPVDLTHIPNWITGLHWVICGGETGPGARPMHPAWVRTLRDQCHDPEIPFGDSPSSSRAGANGAPAKTSPAPLPGTVGARCAPARQTQDTSASMALRPPRATSW